MSAYLFSGFLWFSLMFSIGFPQPSAAYEESPKWRYAEASLSDVFPHPAGLNAAVDFWRKVFSVWQRTQVVFHDDENLGVVYDIVDLPPPYGEGLTAAQQSVVRNRRDALEEKLRGLEERMRKGETLTPEQRSLADSIVKAGGNFAIHGAAGRLRSQRGMRERFREGVALSGRYEAQMRRVFRSAGLPEELALLPHVESSFVNHAYSSAGAVGVWQFTRATGSEFLRINGAVDERRDPVLASLGAARYLKKAYGRLGDWGLAVTSYNHGIYGMLGARQEFGADIEKIVRYYKGPRFGFASRNFYAEFLAVRSIVGDLGRHFPEGVRLDPPQDPGRIRLMTSTSFQRLANLYVVSPGALARLNPALSETAVKGKIALPPGTDIWLPKASLAKARVSAAYATRQDRFTLEKPAALVFNDKAQAKSGGRVRTVIQPAGSRRTHIVRKGETAHRIASRYGVPVVKMLALNDLGKSSIIRPGQQLRIPAK
ncbi:MAG: transglycosylase SLT domain-containing protein [Gammaproteobacteria bacterium]